MAAFGVEISLQGIKPLLAKLERIPRKQAKAIMRKAVRAGSAPIRKVAKKTAPRDKGILQETMAIKVKQYPSGVSVGVIGPRKKFTKRTKKRGERTLDAFYGHMVEGGTRPHVIPGPIVLGGRVLHNIQHPGTQPTRFMEKSAKQSRAEAVRRLGAKLGSELEKVAKG